MEVSNFFQHNTGLQLLLRASFSVLKYIERSIYHLLGGSNSLILVGLSLSAGESGGAKRVTGKASESSFAHVIIAVTEIDDRSCRINKNVPTISFWELFV